MPTREQWLERFNGDEEAMSQFFRDNQAKSRINYSGNGGFRSLDKDKLKEISKKGAQARWHGKDSSEQESQGQ